MVGISIPSPHITDVLITDGNTAILERDLTDVQIHILDFFGDLSQCVELGKSIVSSVLACVIVICIAF